MRLPIHPFALLAAGMRLYLGYGRDLPEMLAARRWRQLLELAF